MPIIPTDRNLTDAELLKLVTTPAPADPLSAREIQVARLLTEGMSNKQIASTLRVSFHTARFHVMNVSKKLGAGGSRVLAAVIAVRMGLAGDVFAKPSTLAEAA